MRYTYHSKHPCKPLVLLTILAPACLNHYRPSTFTLSSQPSIDGHYCVTPYAGSHCTAISEASQRTWTRGQCRRTHRCCSPFRAFRSYHLPLGPPFTVDRETGKFALTPALSPRRGRICPPILVGGTEDHVHMLCRLGRTISQADWVKEVKRVSHVWSQERWVDYQDFQWQGGYADFSVSQSNLEEVKVYIAGQEEHHRKVSFQDELRALLRKHELQWDERYVWE